MSTMRDVAMRAGVSAKTVSRVMNNDRYVSDDVRERVMRAVGELEYVPNAMAKSFRSGQDSSIGIAVPVLDPFFSQITQTVEEIARARGVAVFVTCFGDDPDNEQPALEALLSRHLAGLIVAPSAADQSYLKPWRNRTAMLFIDRRPKKFVADSIISDDYGGARKAIDHLIAHGHRRIAFAGDALTVSPTARRRQVYESALFDNGVGLDPFLVAMRADVVPAIPRLLALSSPPTAIFSASPTCTQYLAAQLHAAGRTDIALIGFGDFLLADMLTPPITVIDQDPLGLGKFAAERLFQRIDDPARRLRRNTVLPVNLVARESCRLAPPIAVPARREAESGRCTV
jgi:LacI family transcriptional regulator